MDSLHSTKQPQTGETPSKKAPSANKRSKQSSKSRRKKKRRDDGQNAGQPSAGEVGTSSRAAATATGKTTAEEREGNSATAPIHKVASCTAGAMHALDATLGLALVVYGAIVHGAPEVTAACVCYGLLLFLGAAAGAVGYFSGSCNRRGLIASAVAGFLACILDAAAFVFALASWDSLVKFLEDNREGLMLSEGSVDAIGGLKVLFAVIFAVLAVLEAFRSYAMWSMNKSMASSSDKSPPILKRTNSDSRCDWCLALMGLQKKKKVVDFIVFERDTSSLDRPLLWSGDDESTQRQEDYLEFIPEHERGLTSFAETVALPSPPKDRVDY